MLRLASRDQALLGPAVPLPGRRRFSSPVTSSGKNIFLSYGNLTDMLPPGLDHRPGRRPA